MGWICSMTDRPRWFKL